jgi:hypothetical protein
MFLSASQRLQYRLRQQRDQNHALLLPGRTRWRDGVMLWGEFLFCLEAEAAQWRDHAPRMHMLTSQAPTLGLVITPEFEQQGNQLALDIDHQGYGGLVHFSEIEDNLLRVLLGDGLYPLVVSEDRLEDFWLRLLDQNHHFLLVADQQHCYGYWESNLALSME